MRAVRRSTSPCRPTRRALAPTAASCRVREALRPATVVSARAVALVPARPGRPGAAPQAGGTAPADAQVEARAEPVLGSAASVPNRARRAPKRAVRADWLG